MHRLVPLFCEVLWSAFHSIHKQEPVLSHSSRLPVGQSYSQVQHKHPTPDMHGCENHKIWLARKRRWDLNSVGQMHCISFTEKSCLKNPLSSYKSYLWGTILDPMRDYTRSLDTACTRLGPIQHSEFQLHRNLLILNFHGNARQMWGVMHTDLVAALV